MDIFNEVQEENKVIDLFKMEVGVRKFAKKIRELDKHGV